MFKKVLLVLSICLVLVVLLLIKGPSKEPVTYEVISEHTISEWFKNGSSIGSSYTKAVDLIGKNQGLSDSMLTGVRTY